jgi:hypothetical protein
MHCSTSLVAEQLPNMSATLDQSSPATRVATPIPEEKMKTSETFPDSPTTVVVESPPEDDVLANA